MGKKQTADNMFAGRIRDLIKGSEYTVRASSFLSPAEQKEVFDVASSEGAGERCFFWGGAPGAERRIALFLPEWLCAEDERFGGAFDERREEFVRDMIASGGDGGDISSEICALKISGSAYSELSHRDYLGALLALGLERSSTGDIEVADASTAYVFITRKAAPLVLNELSSVGRESVSAAEFLPGRDFRIEHEFEVITDTVMSPRLDGIVKALCSISREAASDLVESGDVSVNYTQTVKTDLTVEKGDIISVRGYGKFIYDGDRGINRRGRLRIDARKYI